MIFTYPLSQTYLFFCSCKISQPYVGLVFQGIVSGTTAQGCSRFVADTGQI